ncbi:FAD-dependent oxidoreductase [Sphingomonas sp. LY54]|uniref:FAD-dependent oxidoreductase n=1 Tax=Sphingomonas sp. LY54 TaxID=3095343 RepID=UPI002D7A1AB2|nr:FAD-dependent oxidoreductase [Sphingomonas sp. LY54]WRP29970.1 FAD-dependent oxidoreductase [Sphingomonas sp. LY54]
MRDGSSAVVLGAGVVGVATAYALARRGVAVTLVDRNAGPGRGTSFANGAQLSYVYTDALAAPALIARIPWLAMARDQAFRLSPSFDLDFLRWGLSFLRNGTLSRFHANTLDGLRLGLESRLAMHALLERHPIEFGHAAPGKIHLYKTAASLAAASSLVDLKRTLGAVQHVLTPQETLAVEPALDGVISNYAGAIHSPQEEVGDAWRFCVSLTECLERDYGVRTRFGLDVAKVDLSSARPALVAAGGERIEADRLAVCAGVDAPPLLRTAGLRARIWPMKGYSFTAPPGPQSPRTSITDVARKLVFCRLSGKMRVAGLADLGRRDLDVDQKRLDALIGPARSGFPEAVHYDRIESTWAGLRPMTPNSLPMLERPRPDVVLNLGHGALGWTYAMGSAERAAGALAMASC